MDELRRKATSVKRKVHVKKIQMGLISSDTSENNELEEIDDLESEKGYNIPAKNRVVSNDRDLETGGQELDNISSHHSSSSTIHSTSGSSAIRVNLVGLSQRKINQMKRLKKLIKLSHTYSIYYHSFSRLWKWIYWISSIIGLILAASAIVVNIFYDPCSNKEIVRKYNVLISTVITAFLGLITLLNAQLRRRNYEEAGDEYKILAQEIYREVFFSNLSFEDLDLSYIIEKHSIRFDDYTKMFREPSPQKIRKIKDSIDYGLSIKFIV